MRPLGPTGPPPHERMAAGPRPTDMVITGPVRVRASLPNPPARLLLQAPDPPQSAALGLPPFHQQLRVEGAHGEEARSALAVSAAAAFGGARDSGGGCWRPQLAEPRRWRRASPSPEMTGRKRLRGPRAPSVDYKPQRPLQPRACALAAGTLQWRLRWWRPPKYFGNAAVRVSGPV